MIAWDTPNKRVWWGLNGTWTHTTGDPSTAGTGIYLADVGLVGQTGTTSETESFSLAFFGASGYHTVKAQIYAGEANALTYSIPTGFGRQ